MVAASVQTTTLIGHSYAGFVTCSHCYFCSDKGQSLSNFNRYLSCRARELGDPVLVFLLIFSAKKICHSRLVSSVRSKITVPHLLQIISPDSLSGIAMLLFFYLGHFAVICCGCDRAVFVGRRSPLCTRLWTCLKL
jgi:hypothetical protein